MSMRDHRLRPGSTAITVVSVDLAHTPLGVKAIDVEKSEEGILTMAALTFLVIIVTIEVLPSTI